MYKVLANINPSVKKRCYLTLAFLFLPERHQATLDELHVLMQRFPSVITDIDAIQSEFFEHQATPDNKFPTYFEENKPCTLITFGTKYLNKLIYTLVKIDLNTLYNLLNFYF